MRVGITGATGFIGRALIKALTARGDTAVAFTRSASKRRGMFGERVEVLPLDELSPSVMSRLDAVVNLAGEPVAAGRWTDARKDAILRSRVEVTRAVVGAMASATPRPRVLVNASAVGYYGPRGDDAVVEADPAGDDFLASVCRAWESEAEAATELGVRVVRPRIGVVLGDDGGALDQMLPAFKMFVGGPVGDGKQYLPWVHRDDVVGMLLMALDRDEVHGAMNVTAPDPARFSDFAKELGAALSRPSWLPVPGLALKLAFGELSQVLLTGQRAVPRAAQGWGYAFKFAVLRDALRDVLTKRRDR